MDKQSASNIIFESKFNLGDHAFDLVSGFCGVITSVYFNFEGNFEYLITAKQQSIGEISTSEWFDESRLDRIG